jgi:hypothetical protein
MVGTAVQAMLSQTVAGFGMMDFYKTQVEQVIEAKHKAEFANGINDSLTASKTQMTVHKGINDTFAQAI